MQQTGNAIVERGHSAGEVSDEDEWLWTERALSAFSMRNCESCMGVADGSVWSNDTIGMLDQVMESRIYQRSMRAQAVRRTCPGLIARLTAGSTSGATWTGHQHPTSSQKGNIQCAHEFSTIQHPAPSSPGAAWTGVIQRHHSNSTAFRAD